MRSSPCEMGNQYVFDRNKVSTWDVFFLLCVLVMLLGRVINYCRYVISFTTRTTFAFPVSAPFPTPSLPGVFEYRCE
jgi:hypothetical protein